MKRIAVAQLLLLTTVLTGHAEAQPRVGPVMRAILEDPVPRISGAKPKEGWPRVMALAPGTDILVEVTSAHAAPRVFVHADETELVVLDLAGPRLDARVRRMLQETASKRPDYLVQVATGFRFVQDNVHVGPGGVFLRERKVAEISDVIKRVAKPEIVAIKAPPQRRGSRLGAAVGAGAGFAIGFPTAMRFAYKQCNGSCSGEEAVMALSMVAFPIGGALLGYQARIQMTQEVIYRAPF